MGAGGGSSCCDEEDDDEEYEDEEEGEEEEEEADTPGQAPAAAAAGEGEQAEGETVSGSKDPDDIDVDDDEDYTDLSKGTFFCAEVKANGLPIGPGVPTEVSSPPCCGWHRQACSGCLLLIGHSVAGAESLQALCQKYACKRKVMHQALGT